jgi:hypothetical protein
LEQSDALYINAAMEVIRDEISSGIAFAPDPIICGIKNLDPVKIPLFNRAGVRKKCISLGVYADVVAL